MLNESVLNGEPLARQTYWYLQRRYHQLQWATLHEIAYALGLVTDDNAVYSECDPHQYHRQPQIGALMKALLPHDGRFWDIRTGFHGIDDAVRLRANTVNDIGSIPALAWKERIYAVLLRCGCHDDEKGVEIRELIRCGSGGLGLVRPLSLSPASLPIAPLSSTRTFQAQTTAQDRIAEQEQRDKLLLRRVLEADPVFDVRFGNQLQTVERLACDELMQRLHNHEEVMTKPGGKLPRSCFESELSVYLRERPAYSLFVVGIASRYEQIGQQVRTELSSISEMRVNDQVVASEFSHQTQAAILRDLPTESGFAACGVVLRRRRVRDLLPPAPFSDSDGVPTLASSVATATTATTESLGLQGNIQSREDVIWHWRSFVGSNSTRCAAEYTALAKALELCARKGYYPLTIYTNTKDIPRNMRAASGAEGGVAVTHQHEAKLHAVGKNKKHIIHKADQKQKTHVPNPYPAIKGASMYILGAHKQCADYIMNIQSQTKLSQHSMPEYYNILGLPMVKSKRSSNPTHTNSTIYTNAAHTLTSPTGQLTQLTGRPSQFHPWSDEMYARTSIGKYCSVTEDQAVTFHVVTRSEDDSAGAHDHCFAEALSMARISQEDGFVISRGHTVVPECSVEPAEKFNSLKVTNKVVRNDNVSWWAETPTGTSGKDPQFGREQLPGIRHAKELVFHEFAHKWDHSVVGTQPEECALVRFQGNPTSPLIPTVIEEQPVRYLR